VSWLSPPRRALAIGVAAGLVIGLVYTWAIDPMQLLNTEPSLLRAEYRQDWVRTLALSFVADGDLQRAQARQDGLSDDEVAEGLADLIEEYYAAGRPADTMRRLTALADALDVYTPGMLAYLLTPTPTREATPSPAAAGVTPGGPTATVRPPTRTPTQVPDTPTPSSTPIPDFRPASQQELCEPGESARVEVVVTDGLGDGLTGVVVWLIWPGGAQRAVTGLKPDQGPGYVDFGAELGQGYSLGGGELGLPLVDGLSSEACSSEPGEEEAVSSWRIVLEPTDSD